MKVAIEAGRGLLYKVGWLADQGKSAVLEAAMAKQSKSVASNQAKLEASEAKRSQAEKSLVEAKKKQAEAEKKLETTLKESNALADKQKKGIKTIHLAEVLAQS